MKRFEFTKLASEKGTTMYKMEDNLYNLSQIIMNDEDLTQEKKYELDSYVMKLRNYMETIISEAF
jgi:hypothetical protein